MTENEIMKFLVGMIVMMNPLGSLSIFLDLTKGTSILEQRKIATTSCMAMVIIMLITVWSGDALLSLLGITIASFRFAGGIILLLMGLSMLQSKDSPSNHTTEDDEAAKSQDSIAIVPLSLPVIIGPGAISLLIITSNDHPQLLDKAGTSLICTLLALGMSAMLYYARPIAKLFGLSMIKVVTRIMGMIIMSLAVGMLADGLIGLIPTLR